MSTWKAWWREKKKKHVHRIHISNHAHQNVRFYIDYIYCFYLLYIARNISSSLRRVFYVRCATTINLLICHLYSWQRRRNFDVRWAIVINMLFILFYDTWAMERAMENLWRLLLNRRYQIRNYFHNIHPFIDFQLLKNAQVLWTFFIWKAC